MLIVSCSPYLVWYVKIRERATERKRERERRELEGELEMRSRERRELLLKVMKNEAVH
jgi:hypothetical protein